MDKKELSIIIPCYNSVDILKEAVDSIFKQNLKSFEVIFVDDKSTDGTPELITEFCKKNKNFFFYSHEKNKGGGAARNTGIQKSIGNFIFCLDSDNILYPFSLNKMLDYIKKTGSDAVAFQERRFFHSKNIKDFTCHFNPIIDTGVTLDNLFDQTQILLDNFLYTRESYFRTNGYPEHHGFDTQTFEMRFLDKNKKVLICPDSIFYHRQNSNSPSYFEREYNNGNFSINYYFAIEDIWSTLTQYAKKEILGYDIFKNSSLNENILLLLKKLYSENKLLITQLKEKEIFDDSIILYDNFIKNYISEDYASAQKYSLELLKSSHSKIAFLGLLRSTLGLQKIERNLIEKNTFILLKSILPKENSLNKWYHRNLFTHSIINFTRKIWKK